MAMQRALRIEVHHLAFSGKAAGAGSFPSPHLKRCSDGDEAYREKQDLRAKIDQIKLKLSKDFGRRPRIIAIGQ
jgi:hypothetical protein